MQRSVNVVGDQQRSDGRADARVRLNLPVAVRRQHGPHVSEHVGCTFDISAGGIHFETDHPQLQVGDLIGLRMAIPTQLGYLPVTSSATAEATVVRVQVDSADTASTPVRVRVAARFSRPMKLGW